MADEADQASVDTERFEALSLAAIREAAAAIEPGVQGECSRCGEEHPRLVRGVCPPCRDKYKLP